MRTFTLNVITSGRQEITVQKDREYDRVTVRGIDPEMMVSAEDARDLSAMFAGVEKMLRGYRVALALAVPFTRPRLRSAPDGSRRRGM